MEKEIRPVYHVGPDRRSVRQLEGVIKRFADAMKKNARKLVEARGGLPKVVTTDELLKLRTALVEAVTEGMIAQKDQENLIGTLAAMVWFCRLEEANRRRILGEWG